jgi:hypothetical protein
MGIPDSIIKAAQTILAPFLVNLFNDCIIQMYFPKEWKSAIVTPLKKKGDSYDANNYRGISVLPPICKIFERILAVRIKDYFETNN